MDWEERHGGLWVDRAEPNDTVLSEHYDPELDSFMLIRQRASDDYFQVEFLIKVADPQFSLPVWDNIAGEGIFGTLAEAERHLKTLAQEHREKNKRI